MTAAPGLVSRIEDIKSQELPSAEFAGHCSDVFPTKLTNELLGRGGPPCGTCRGLSMLRVKRQPVVTLLKWMLTSSDEMLKIKDTLAIR